MGFAFVQLMVSRIYRRRDRTIYPRLAGQWSGAGLTVYVAP